MHVRIPLLAALLLTALVASVAVTACDDDDQSTGQDDNVRTATRDEPAQGTPSEVATAEDGELTVDVVLNEYSVQAEEEAIGSGDVTFHVSNEGTLQHEFIVIKTDLAADSLPVRNEGVALDQLDVLANEALPSARTEKDVELSLDAGDYVLICNQPGHYQSGMRTRLTAQ